MSTCCGFDCKNNHIKMRVQLPDSHWGTRTVDAYEREEQVGEGTYGQVYRARNKVTGQVVALKKIRVHHERNGLPLTAIREIKVLRSVQHRNMVNMLEIVTSKGKEDDDTIEEKDGISRARLARGNIYLVLEYVEHDLSGLIDMGYQFTDTIIKTIMRQLFEVLHHLHANSFLHRDIKCSNLLLTPHHELKLADFGLTRAVTDAREKEFSNNVITLWYRPPELLLGETNYGPGVDMWSVGCILAELILGKGLFVTRTEAEQLTQIFKVLGTPTAISWPGYTKLPLFEKMQQKREQPNRFREYYSTRIPPDALDLIERLLTLDPERRLSAQGALASKYFHTDPLPVDPISLPTIKLPECHEMRTKQFKKEQAGLEASQEARSTTEAPATKRHKTSEDDPSEVPSTVDGISGIGGTNAAALSR